MTPRQQSCQAVKQKLASLPNYSSKAEQTTSLPSTTVTHYIVLIAWRQSLSYMPQKIIATCAVTPSCVPCQLHNAAAAHIGMRCGLSLHLAVPRLLRQIYSIPLHSCTPLQPPSYPASVALLSCCGPPTCHPAAAHLHTRTLASRHFKLRDPGVLQ